MSNIIEIGKIDGLGRIYIDRELIKENDVSFEVIVRDGEIVLLRREAQRERTYYENIEKGNAIRNLDEVGRIMLPTYAQEKLDYKEGDTLKFRAEEVIVISK